MPPLPPALATVMVVFRPLFSKPAFERALPLVAGDCVRAELADGANAFLLAFVDGAERPIGYAKLRTGTTDPSVTGLDPVELERLYVDRSALGHGVGAALMRASLDAARSAGHRTLWLGVWERNARSRSTSGGGSRRSGTTRFGRGRTTRGDVIMERPVSGVL